MRVTQTPCDFLQRWSFGFVTSLGYLLCTTDFCCAANLTQIRVHENAVIVLYDLLNHETQTVHHNWGHSWGSWYGCIGPGGAHHGWIHLRWYSSRFSGCQHDVFSSHRQRWRCGCGKFSRCPPVCRCCWTVCRCDSSRGICGWSSRCYNRRSCRFVLSFQETTFR